LGIPAVRDRIVQAALRRVDTRFKALLGKLTQGTGAGEVHTAGRMEPEGNRGGGEPDIAGLVWLFPAQQGEHVWLRGRLREAEAAEFAAMAAGWAGQRDWGGPSTLAERMVCPLWAAVLGSGTRVDADNRGNTNPLTGEPDAGDPPVRFGGRGKVNPLSLPYLV